MTRSDLHEYQGYKVDFILKHSAAAGRELNLQTSEYKLIWFSTTWPLEYYQQTNTSLYSKGQKNV